MKFFQLLIIGILFVNQNGDCQSENSNLIQLKCNFAHATTEKMSEIFSEIKYVPLETNSDCLIGYMYISVFGEDIIIQSHNNNSIYRFSSNGKFLNKIGRMGRGPKEYQDYCEVRLINDTVFVVSNFTNSVICYSKTGLFLKRYHINVKERPKSIAQLPDLSFMIALNSQSSYGNILKTDNKFNVETGYSISVAVDMNPLPFGFRGSKNKTYFFYNYLDTIFEISKGFPVPSIHIDYEKYKISQQKLSIDEKRNIILNKPNILDFYASNEYLKLTVFYPLERNSYTLMYRNADGKQILWSKLVNDIDNGVLDKWPGILVGDKIVFWLMPMTILKRFNDMTGAEKLDPKNSEFVKLASNILPESNPVLMVCKLK